MKHLLIFVITSLFCQLGFGQISISEARTINLGEEVTIEGISTNGSELGIIRYLQDNTGAVAVYPGAGSVGDFPGEVNRGDLVQVRGILKEYNGLIEVDPVLSYTVISSGNALPEPVIGSPNDLNESNEAVLYTIENVTFSDGGNVFGVGNFTFTSGNEEGEIYVRSNHPLIGEEIPLATVDVTGIVSQFNSIYQLLPRGLDDFVIKDNFFLTAAPKQSNISKSGFDVTWETNTEGNSIVRYGTTTALGEEIIVAESVTNHSVTLTNLEAGEFYYVQVISENGSTSVTSPLQYYSTESNSSGEVRIYFNHEVDGNVSTGSYANGYTGLVAENAILDLIEKAESTIDVAMYNINRDRIVNALIAAHNRGVVVRYIADNETANLALDPAPPFFVIRGNSEGLMHNKFYVIDGASVDNAYVIGGSMNMTEQNIVTDYNNMVVVQDQALAKAYTIEFEEMWGSSNESPGVFTVKFGPAKTDNTPHNFVINGISVEQYFSPSDKTTLAISRNIAEAENDLQFALLTFTNNELGTAVANAHNRNVEIRGIMDNNGDQGSEFDFLVNTVGVNITLDNTTKSTHHKYCIIDALGTSPNGVVVTGSHNWSGGAETRNDENTMVFHDNVIANIYLQEFEARWCEATSGANCTTSTEIVDKLDGVEYNVFPNPAVDASNIAFKLDQPKDIVVSLFDVNGKMISSVIKNNLANNSIVPLDVEGLPAGQYIVTITSDNDTVSEIINIVK